MSTTASRRARKIRMTSRIGHSLPTAPPRQRPPAMRNRRPVSRAASEPEPDRLVTGDEMPAKRRGSPTAERRPRTAQRRAGRGGSSLIPPGILDQNIQHHRAVAKGRQYRGCMDPCDRGPLIAGRSKGPDAFDSPLANAAGEKRGDDARIIFQPGRCLPLSEPDGRLSRIRLPATIFTPSDARQPDFHRVPVPVYGRCPFGTPWWPRRLPSTRVTRLHRYFAAIRLPRPRLPSSPLRLVPAYSLAEETVDLPGYDRASWFSMWYDNASYRACDAQDQARRHAGRSPSGRT